MTRLTLLLTTALAATVLLLGLTAYLSWHSNRQQQRANQEVRQIYELIAQIEQLATRSRDAYTDLRNYDLSGKAEFLSAFQAANQQLPQQLQQLEQALKNNPPALHQLHQLGHFINQRLQLGQRLLAYHRHSDKDRLQEPLLEQGRQLLGQIRPVVSDLIRRQQEFVDGRQQRVEQTYQQTQLWIVVSTLAALVVIGVVFWILRQQLLRRMRNESRLEQYEADLQAQLRQQQAHNQELARLNQELARSNESLQQFAYVASHDLQEPLRKIQQFGDLLRSQYAAPASNGIDYLGRMQAAASRMSMLIRDLLAYSRITSNQATTTTVSLWEVVQTTLADLDLRIEETGAQIIVDPLPTVQGDPLQFNQLFLNLLSNALKFRRTDQAGGLLAPLIRISNKDVGVNELPASVNPSRIVAFYHRIDVADNGTGFDEKYLDRIFDVFQRLHGKADFVGTGIGLAICKKVVTNQGGAITATSQPGQGATFSVYLPV